MPTIRIEARMETRSGLYFVEIYYPAGAEQPFVTTEPRYMSEAAAENDTIAILAASANGLGRIESGRVLPLDSGRATDGASDRGNDSEKCEDVGMAH